MLGGRGGGEGGEEGEESSLTNETKFLQQFFTSIKNTGLSIDRIEIRACCFPSQYNTKKLTNHFYPLIHNNQTVSAFAINTYKKISATQKN